MNREDMLAFLKNEARGIAAMFGPNCETLVHDMTRPGHPILAIYNGTVTGREVGSTADIFGKDILLNAGQTYYIAVESGDKGKGYQNVMYKPGENDFDLYWSRDEIVVTDIISEAPLRIDEPHKIMLEKKFVDMIADKLISTTYNKAEFPDVIEQVQSRYYLDKVRLLRYARRRNREKEMKQYLEGSAIENAVT